MAKYQNKLNLTIQPMPMDLETVTPLEVLEMFSTVLITGTLESRIALEVAQAIAEVMRKYDTTIHEETNNKKETEGGVPADQEAQG